jgi:MFS family permease
MPAAVVPGLRHDIFGDPANYWGPIQFLIHLMQPLLGANPENTLLGLLNMAFMVTYMLGAPIGSALKVHRWYIIGVGLIVWSFASGGSGMAASFEMMLLTRMMVGVGEAAYGPIAPTMIAEMFPSSVRATVLAMYQATTPIGSAIAYGVGMYVMAKYNWRWAFYIAAAPGFIVGIMCFFMHDPGYKSTAEVEKRQSWKERMAEFTACLGNRSYVYNVLAASAMTFAIGGIAFWIPDYIVEFRKVGNIEMIGVIFGAILAVCGLGGTVVGGWISDRKNRTDKSAYMKTSGWAMYAAGVFSVAMLFVPFPYAWGLMAAAVFFLFFNTGSNSAIITNVTAPEMRASAFALSIFITHALGDVISPFVIGAITDATGSMTIAFLAVSVAIGLAGFLWLRGAPHLAADSQHTNT